MTKNLAGYRLLLIEDEEIIASLLEEYLDQAGAMVIGIAMTVDEAVSMLAGLRPDGVLLDLNLNGMNVNPLLFRLRETGTPFVVTTGYEREDLKATFPEEVVMKPYDRCEVLGAVTRMLRPPLFAAATPC